MGIEIVQIGNGDKAAQMVGYSDNDWTSNIIVQGHQRVNVGIRVSDAISDILSAAGHSAGAVSAIASFFSGTITLQRRMANENNSYDWRDIATWAISSSAVGQGGSENITASPEPETCTYRLGIKTAEYTGGVTHLRLGTS